jgi:hypothetical protein
MSGPHGVGRCSEAKSAIFGFGIVGLRASHGDDGPQARPLRNSPAMPSHSMQLPAPAHGRKPRLSWEADGRLLAVLT